MNAPRLLQDRFVVPRESLASGGHAKLFRAYDTTTEDHVALKMFAPAAHVDPKVLRLSWSNELAAYQGLGEHPNLLRVVDFGTPHDGEPWIAFEWCAEDLVSLVERQELDWNAFRPIAIEVLRGLSVLHAKSWVHRDLKPGNVLIDEGRVKVADFGTMRYREVTSYGQTMNQLGTRPYSPPETGTESPTPAYDVYSFAVLVVCCLSRDFELIARSPEAVLAELHVPDDVRLLLARCLDEEPTNRPSSAPVVLAELEQIHRGEPAPRETSEIGLFVGARTQQAFADLTQADSVTLDDIRREFGPRVRVLSDPKRTKPTEIVLVGRSLLAAVQPHERRSGTLFVRSVWRPSVSFLERVRKRSVSFTVRWVPNPMRPKHADETINEMIRLVQEHEAASPVASQRSEVHARWEKVLDAKYAVARATGRDLQFSSVRIDGARAHLTLRKGGADEAELGELRMIRTTTNRVVRGEVEAIEGNEIVLYVNDGNVEDLPRSGVISIDAERSVSKIRREQEAVRRVFEVGAARADLKDILNDPSLNPIPAPADVTEFAQDQLDEAKRSAVRTVLGSQGISLVKGPPGTGKTTLIAELVAQQLKRKPDSRILLASQTHIALDHALSKVTMVSPEASVLRIGSPDRNDSVDEAWAIPSQLAAWKVETAERLADFIERRLQSTGSIDVEMRSTATRLRALVDRRERTREELAEVSAALTHAQAGHDAVRERVEALFQAAGELERRDAGSSALNTDIAAVADEITRVVAAIERNSETVRQLDPLKARVFNLSERQTSLEVAVSDAVTSLKADERFANAADESELLSLVDSYTSADDKRLQAFQLLADEWLERFRPNGEFRVALLFRAAVVASTCVALTGSRGAENVKFDLCIVDEASKAAPTELMVPMANSMQWVLVGDEKQLPPFLDGALTKKTLLSDRDLTLGEVDERLFATLGGALPSACVSALSHQHRMHADIGRVVSDVFYGGTLRSTGGPVSPLVEKALGGSVTWHDTGLTEDARAGLSFHNRAEARAVDSVIRHIDNYASMLGLEDVEIAVLSGYSSQVRTLQEVLSNSKSARKVARVRVATIDSYQGQEADICILSLTRSNPQGDVGFLSQPERLNVAVSRARDALVVVGNRRMALKANRNAKSLHALASAIPRKDPMRDGR